jgi:hypothetical protein
MSPTDTPRVLMITNELNVGDEAGFRDALEQLTVRSEIAAWTVLEPRAWLRAGLSWEECVKRTVEATHIFSPDILIVLSPGTCPWRGADVIKVLGAAGGDALLLYWEGDAWGGRKRVNESMDSWAVKADILFTVAGGKQARRLADGGARDVRLVLQTYCHVQYAEALVWSASRTDFIDRPVDVVSICNSAVKWPLVPAGVPGARQRRRLVTSLQAERRIRFGVYGHGWSGATALGPIAYGSQMHAMRQSLITVNWDHLPSLPGYNSDRLPISLLAGRVHVSTRHAQTPWLPGLESGLVLAETPQAAKSAVVELARRSPEELLALGQRAHQWVLGRLSDVESMRFMLGSVSATVLPPPPDPWSKLPTFS